MQSFIMLFKTCFNKHLLFLIIVCSLTNNTQATNYSTNNENFEKPYIEWTLLKEVSGITVYYKISKCESQTNIVDPLNFDPSTLDNHETFALKFVNNNATSKSINFSKVTTTDGSDEMQTITINIGTTIIESCEATAKLILTQNSSDTYPVSVTAFLDEFKLTTNN